jgi:hypothetical protein
LDCKDFADKYLKQNWGSPLDELMMKHQLRFSRRNMLKTIGAGAALLPLLESDPADAACLVGGIKRLFIMAWPDGMLSSINTWSPPGTTPTNWTLAPFQQSLAPNQADLLLLNGVDYSFIKDMPGTGERTGHGCFPGMLTGKFYQTLSASTSADLAGGPSVDQYIGSQLQTAGYKGLVSLNLGAYVVSTGHLSWKAAGEVVLPNTDPTSIFNTYFQGAMPAPAPTSGSGTPAPVDNTKLIKKSILDAVAADLTRFSGVVGTADKQNIQQHLTSVRELEMQLDSMGSQTMAGGSITAATGTCSPPTVPAGMSGKAANTSPNVPAVTKLMMDLSVAAFASDLTRVVVFQVCDQGAANLIMSWVKSSTGTPFASGGPLASDPNTGDTYGFHAIAHRNVQDKVNCDTWFQSQLAYMVAQMASIKDATNQRLLDSSVVVGMNNMRTGTHETTGVPVFMAGSCGGYFKTGRSLALPPGTPNNGLLVALCNAMGTPVTTFGEASYGGELTVLKG